MSKLVFDGDAFKYAIASVGETRTIRVRHKPSGRVKEFNNRTELWGRGKTIGGYLGEVNKKRIEKGLSPFDKSEFEIEDIQTVEPIQNVLHSLKLQVDGILSKLGTKKYKMYLGKGDSFRVGESTILKYKGQRENLIKPLLLDEVTDYLVKKYKAEIVTNIEADDACVIDCYKNDNILVGLDKDYLGCAVNYYRFNQSDAQVIDCNCFGKLWRKENGDVTGYGRMFHYFQIASGDTIDNYFANSASDIKWGDVSAYNELVDCKTDLECIVTLYKIYKHLYPEPRDFIGWRGDVIRGLNWEYVLDENTTMATMLHNWYSK